MADIWNLIKEFATSSGIASFFANGGWKNLIMIAIAIVLVCLAIFKDVEPYLLLPISFGMLLANLTSMLPDLNQYVFYKVSVEDAAENPALLEGLNHYITVGG